MSNEIQKTFEEVVKSQYSENSNELALNPPEFENIGFLTKVKFVGTEGFVEILLGPPEYHAELFIENFDLKLRVGLAEIFSSEAVQRWAEQNKPDHDESIRVKREVAWIFLLLTKALQQYERFKWLFNP